MHLLLLSVVFLSTHDFSTPLRSQCASRCDTTACPSPSCPGGLVLDRCNCCMVCSPRDGARCGRRNDPPCGDGLECKALRAKDRRETGGVCRCNEDSEVCGSDGKTYRNVCRMKASSRRAVRKGRAEVIQARKGACPGPGAGRTLVRANSPRYKFNFIADVVEKIAPAVVHIELFVRHPLLAQHVHLSSGSGFMVTHSGVIVTNAHVVTTTTNTVTGSPQLRVQLPDGDAYEAVVRDVDRKADIATVKINPQKRLPVLSLGRSSDLRPGEFVVAIGSPFSLQNTVTTGIISTAQRDGKELGIKDSDMDYIQTDAIINYGNSGGPLVNLDGEVIGINTLKVAAGISFAIPSDRISRFLSESQSKHSKVEAFPLTQTTRQRKLIEDLQSDAASTTRRYFLGIRMIKITKTLVAVLKRQYSDFPDVSYGVVVQQVIPNTPAEKGGIREGDVVVKLNSKPIKDPKHITEALHNDKPLLLEIRRGNLELLFNIYPQLSVH
ncbi:serine protease HTRA3-like isoform X2 [Gouania willdenowi]|uniref:serine protease HTRA3-like isoform X2 n=1 Tax=Gouania willdenowi TaxID=441366 RepID=UPI001055C591|nr:serine protease HTRA3-like isoform X2 [Gouania willdenowi]